MDITVIKDWLGVVNVLVTAVIGVVVWINGKDKATNSRISEFEHDVDDRLESHNNRLTRLETKIQAMPTHEDIRQLRDEVKRQTEKLDTLLGESKVRAETMKMIHEYLLEHGK